MKYGLPLLLLGGGALVLLVMKGKSYANLGKNLTFTVRLDGKPKLYAGGTITLLTSLLTNSNGSKVRIPLAIDFDNRSDTEVTVGLNSVFLNYNGKRLAQNAPGQRSVTLKKQSTSTMSGIEVDVALSSLIQFAGQTIEKKLTGGDLSSITDNMSIDLGLTLNNAFIVNVCKKFGESASVDTDKSTTIGGLGLVANSQRRIRSVNDYVAYIAPKESLLHKDLVVKSDGSVRDTADLMHKVVDQYCGDVTELAHALKKDSLRATLQNIFNFVYTHIQYVPDSRIREQVRRPLRTLWDQQGDCDCYATLIGAMLKNLGIPFKFRIAAYAAGRYQHVYVIVPTEEGVLAVDPVLDKCFAEKQPTKFFDV